MARRVERRSTIRSSVPANSIAVGYPRGFAARRPLNGSVELNRFAVALACEASATHSPILFD
jgi:hypothetical protein